jgi:DNA-binding transcriptional LysR family regulator
MLNLHHLAVFRAVAAERNVSRGAARLAISQPAVSKQLRELERSLATRLLDRHAKGVSLTAAGEILDDYAQRIFALRDDAERAIADIGSLRRGRLAIGAGPTVGVYLLPRVLVAFRKRFPEIRMSLETAGPDTLRERLIDGVMDFAITETPPPTAAELESRTLMHDVLVPIAAKGQPIATGTKKRLTAAEFCRQPFVAREVEPGAKSLVERTLLGRGLEIRPVLTVASTEAIKQAVIAGLGVAMVSRLSVRTEVAARQLVELNVRGLAIRYPIQHVRLRGKSESRAANEFLQLFAKALGD